VGSCAGGVRRVDAARLQALETAIAAGEFKKIGSVLVGIAIDKNLLPGPQATILPFFGDKQPLKNPDPRKQRISADRQNPG
jgi:hypothetical protein